MSFHVRFGQKEKKTQQDKTKKTTTTTITATTPFGFRVADGTGKIVSERIDRFGGLVERHPPSERQIQD